MNASSTLYELAFGINQNFNTIVRVQLALYDAANHFLVATNEIVIQNPIDQVVIGQLSTPYTLLPNTGYNIALWADTSIFNGFNSGGSPAELVPYTSNVWPTVFVSSQANSVRAVQAFGCTTPSTSPSSARTSSSSTGAASGNSCPTPNTVSSSSSGSSLSNGAIAGIVIGCSIGTLLLGMMVVYCLLAGAITGAAGGKKGEEWQGGKSSDEVSRVGRTTHVTNLEMGQVNKEEETA